MSQPSQEFLKNAVYLIDASSYIFRAYYGINPSLTAPDGTPTHATYGFLQMINALLTTQNVKECALLWDQKEKGFRHKIFPEYKANRGAPPEDLGLQLENSKIGAECLGLPQYGEPGFEADDLIATAVAKFPNKNFVVVTGDKDLLQLVNDRVWCLDTMKQKWSNQQETIEKFGVLPEKVPELQALCGDSVDNIPGAPGIGPKTAAQLMQKYGSLTRILELAKERYESGEKIKDKDDPLKGKKIDNLAENIAQVELSLKLVTLSHDAPFSDSSNPFELKPVNHDGLNSFAAKLGLTKVLAHAAAMRSKAYDKHNGILSNSAGSGDAPSIPSEKMNSDRFNFERIKSVSDLEKLLSQNSKSSYLALDTETLGLDDKKGEWRLVGISLAFDGKTGHYIPLRHVDVNGELIKENLDPKETIKALKKYLDSDNQTAKIVFQNAKFDLHVFQREGLHFAPDRIEDTMVMSFVCNPSERHNMDTLAQRWLAYDCLSFKEALGDRENFSFVNPEEATRYAAEDAVVTFSIFEELKKELAKDEKLNLLYHDLDIPLISILFELEENGICLDLETLKSLSKQFHRETDVREKEAIAILEAEGLDLPEDFNLGSPKQIAKVLFEDLKLPIIKKGKTGPSTDVSVLEALSAQHPFPHSLLEIREIKKLTSTYIDVFPTLIKESTGRLHTDFSQIIAVTGRLSSSNPNLQNIPIRTERGKKIRDAFIAPPGKILLGIDYSQVELRILAEISGDKELCRAFSENADIHKRTAALVLGIEEDKVTSNDRRMAKAINFGIVYGQTPFGLSKSLGIDRKTAKQFIDDYFNTYPGIKIYMNETLEHAKTHLSVRSLAGRVRYLPDINAKNAIQRNFAERTAINTPIQGTAADLIKAAMIDIQRNVLPKFPMAKMVLQIHDELLFEVVGSAPLKALEDEVKAAMENPSILKEFTGKDLKIPMKAEASWGQNWGQLK